MPQSMVVTEANRPSAPETAFQTMSGLVERRNEEREDVSIGEVRSTGQLNSFPMLSSFSLLLFAVAPTRRNPGLLFLK